MKLSYSSSRLEKTVASLTAIAKYYGNRAKIINQRLKDLEAAALSFEGVSSAYAIQAGRELRVMVESGKVNDENAYQLSYDISEKIQNELTYPGQVKVTVIRETRAVNIAR